MESDNAMPDTTRPHDGHILPAIAAASVIVNVVMVALYVTGSAPGRSLDYWLERYQTLITGSLSVSVAAWAAIRLIDQIRKQSEQNTIAKESLRLAMADYRARQRDLMVQMNEIATAIRYDLIEMIRQSKDYIRCMEIVDCIKTRRDELKKVAVKVADGKGELSALTTALTAIDEATVIEVIHESEVDGLGAVFVDTKPPVAINRDAMAAMKHLGSFCKLCATRVGILDLTH